MGIAPTAKLLAVGRRLRKGVADRTRPWRMRRTAQLRDALALAEGAGRRLAARAGVGGRGPARVLMVDDLLPDPLLGAGYPRAFAAVHSLVAAGCAVSFYPMESQPTDVARMTRAFGGAVRFHPGEGAAGLRRLLRRRGAGLQLLFVSRPAPMRALLETGWRAPRTAVIYDAEAVLAPREALRLALLGAPPTAAQEAAALAAEIGLARGADVVTAVSPRDAALIRSVRDVPVFVLSHPVAAATGRPDFTARRDLLFVGRLTGAPALSANVDSLFWFVTAVMPLLDELVGRDYRLHIAGLLDAPELEAVLGDRIVRHGTVERLEPLYDSCRVFVAPTRFAAGIPLKVVEAMGQGIPCVATPLLAGQLGADTVALPSGADAAAFAAQCGALYTDAAAWRRVRDRAAAHVARTHSQEAFDRALADALACARDARYGDARKVSA